MRKMIDKRTKYILFSFFLIFFLVLGFIIIRHNLQSDAYKVVTFKVSDGWGYKIKVQNKDCFYQPFIPGIAGKKAFPDERTANKAGNLVIQKLKNHELPYLTKEDINKIGLDNLGNSD
jgi:hypothetical protein